MRGYSEEQGWKQVALCSAGGVTGHWWHWGLVVSPVHLQEQPLQQAEVWQSRVVNRGGCFFPFSQLERANSIQGPSVAFTGHSRDTDASGRAAGAGHAQPRGSEKGSCKKEGLKEAVGIPRAHVGLCFST